MRPAPAEWALLFALTVMWGSAFALTKAAIAELSPTAVVAARLSIGSLLLLVWWKTSKGRWPRERRLWFFFLLIALFGNVFPFSLISWGQQFIDSGLAGILMAVMPLFTLLLAHFTLPDERMSTTRLGGFVVGLSGVVLLLGPDIRPEEMTADRFVPATLAVLGGALCYAVATILSRLRPASDAVSSAAATTTIGALLVVSIASPAPSMHAIASLMPATLAAVLFLGLFSTGLASVLYFRLIGRAGAAFVSQLNYLIPLWAVVLGALLLDERPSTTDILAMAIILVGVALSQRPPAARANAEAVAQRGSG